MHLSPIHEPKAVIKFYSNANKWFSRQTTTQKLLENYHKSEIEMMKNWEPRSELLQLCHAEMVDQLSSSIVATKLNLLFIQIVLHFSILDKIHRNNTQHFRINIIIKFIVKPQYQMANWKPLKSVYKITKWAPKELVDKNWNSEYQMIIYL